MKHALRFVRTCAVCFTIGYVAHSCQVGVQALSAAKVNAAVSNARAAVANSEARRKQ